MIVTIFPLLNKAAPFWDSITFDYIYINESDYLAPIFSLLVYEFIKQHVKKQEIVITGQTHSSN